MMRNLQPPCRRRNPDEHACLQKKSLMNFLSLFFAEMPEDFAPRKFPLNSSSAEIILVIGAAVLVSLLALLWAAFFRKKRRHHRHSFSNHSSPTAATANTSNPGPESQRGSRRRRRRRHQDLPRNPTLAETGGLPPLRSQNPPEPP